MKELVFGSMIIVATGLLYTISERFEKENNE